METAGFQSDFNRMVVDGSCDGVDLLGAAYFQLRLPVEICIFVLNAAIFTISIGFSWRLIKIYGQCSFERVHKRQDMSRLYVVILTMGTCIQVTVFYLVTAIGLAVDQLTLGPLRDLEQYKPVYLTVDVILLVLAVPWMILGCTSGRMESNARIIVFLALTIAFMAAWATMFTSPVYRLLMKTWTYFAISSITPLVLMFAIVLLTIYSWFHLDLGLAEYLKAEEPSHPADKVRWSIAVTSDPEKGGPLSSMEGPMNTQLQVVWIHPPSPIAVKPPPTAPRRARSYSTPSMSTAESSQESHRTKRKGLTKSTSVYFAASRTNPYSHPPRGLMGPPIGLPVIPVLSRRPSLHSRRRVLAKRPPPLNRLPYVPPNH